VVVDLADYAGQTIQVRFSFHTDSYSYEDGGGWYVDDVLVTEGALVPVTIETPADMGLAVVGEAFGREIALSGGSGAYDWTIEGGSNHGWIDLDPATGTVSGTPLSGNTGPATVTIRATDASNSSNYDQKTFEIQVAEAMLYEPFDGSQPAGWTFGGEWEWGTPTNVGPTACYGGECAGVVMSGEYSNSNTYDVCALDSPSIDLTMATAPVLTFYQYVDTETSFDGGHMEVSNDGGATWTLMDNSVVDPDYYDSSVGTTWAYSGHYSSDGWHQVSVDLSAYAGEVIQVRFAFYSDGSVTYPGWYIDELIILD
jgi:hypothetical protein